MTSRFKIECQIWEDRPGFISLEPELEYAHIAEFEILEAAKAYISVLKAAGRLLKIARAIERRCRTKDAIVVEALYLELVEAISAAKGAGK